MTLKDCTDKRILKLVNKEKSMGREKNIILDKYFDVYAQDFSIAKELLNAYDWNNINQGDMIRVTVELIEGE